MDHVDDSLKAGFSLVEVLLVTGILGIIMTIAVPKLGQDLKEWRLNRYARSIVTANRSARFYALSRQREIQVRYDIDQDEVTFWINENQGYANADDNWVNFDKLDIVHAPSEISFHSVGEITSGQGCQVFKRNGTARQPAQRDNASGEECPGDSSEQTGAGIHMTYTPMPDANNKPCEYRTVYVVTNNAKPVYIPYGAYPDKGGPFSSYKLHTSPSNCDF